MNSITLLSPAKLNLTLEVLGKRPDGYHEIRSIMQPVDLFDEVRIEATEGSGIDIETKGLDIAVPGENLAHRAAAEFLNRSGLELKVNVVINKRIPIEAGLGGGSGNAASVLVGLNKLYKRFSEDELIGISARIGADVPFFIHSRTSLIEGIGEKITLLPGFPLLHYVLINPDLEVPTKDVYEHWDEISSGAPAPTIIEDTIALFKEGKIPLDNALEAPAIEMFPEIISLRGLLEGLEPDGVSMSGSGPTMFGAFTVCRDAKKAYDYLKDSTTLGVYSARGIEGWHRY